MRFILPGRPRRVTLLAPRIGNDVSYVTQITDAIHVAWQAQYLLRFWRQTLLALRIVNDVSSSTGVVLCSTE